MNKILYPLTATLIITADQITKYIVRSSMNVGDKIPVMGNWLRIYYVQNTGTAFSMFAGSRFVTVVLTSILIIVCLIFVYTEYKAGHSFISLLLSFIAAGGLSNLIDRLSLGYVTDMISCGSFAVFNVADIFVTSGCILTMIAVLMMFRTDNSNETDSSDSNGGSDV